MRRFQVRLNLLITQPDIFYNSPLLPGCNRNPGDCGRTPPGHLGQHVRTQQLEAWSPGKAFGRGRRYGQFPVEYIRAPTRSRQYVRRSVSLNHKSLWYGFAFVTISFLFSSWIFGLIFIRRIRIVGGVTMKESAWFTKIGIFHSALFPQLNCCLYWIKEITLHTSSFVL